MQRGAVPLDAGDALNFGALAAATEGYGAADLKDLVARAAHHAVVRGALGARDFEQAQSEFVPLGLRDAQQGRRADVRWSDIGGASRPLARARG